MIMPLEKICQVVIIILGIIFICHSKKLQTLLFLVNLTFYIIYKSISLRTKKLKLNNGMYLGF